MNKKNNNDIKEEQTETVDPRVEEIKQQYKGRIPRGILPEYKERQLKIRLDRKGRVQQIDRLDQWYREFIKNGGNATAAAKAIGTYKSEASAANSGAYYLRRAKNLGRVYLESRGWTYGRLLEGAAKKAFEAKDPDWWDRVMKIAGYADFFPGKNKGGVVNIIGVEKTLTQKYVDGEIEEVEPEEEEETDI